MEFSKDELAIIFDCILNKIDSYTGVYDLTEEQELLKKISDIAKELEKDEKKMIDELNNR